MLNFRIKQKIENGSLIELSNKSVSIFLISFIIFTPVLVGVILVKQVAFAGRGAILYALLLFLICSILYLIIYGGSARMSNDNLTIIKVIGKTFHLKINEIVAVNSIDFGKLKLTTIKFPYEDIIDKVLIINTRKRFEKFEFDPKDVIKEAISHYK